MHLFTLRRAGAGGVRRLPATLRASPPHSLPRLIQPCAPPQSSLVCALSTSPEDATTRASPLSKSSVITALRELDPRVNKPTEEESVGAFASRKKRLQQKLQTYTPRDGRPESGRQLRANAVLQAEIAELFERRDLHVMEKVVPRLARSADAVVEIVDVRISKDFSHCTVFWDPPLLLKGSLKERQLRTIEHALYHPSVIGRIRTFVAKRLKARKAPHVRFARAKYDEALHFMKSL